MSKQDRLRDPLLSNASDTSSDRNRCASIKTPMSSMKLKGSKTKSHDAGFEAVNLQWVRLVIEFFELHYMAIIERRKALRIERFFCNIRRMKIRTLFNAYICRVHGYDMTISKLPRGIKLMILSFLTKNDYLTKISGVDTQFRSLAHDPSLWRNISLLSPKDGPSPF